MLLASLLYALTCAAGLARSATNLDDGFGVKTSNPDDESLMWAFEHEPFLVIEHIQAQQRRIEWLEQIVQRVAPDAKQPRAQEKSGMKQALSHSHTAKRRGFNTLRAAASSCAEEKCCGVCTGAKDCYSHACQAGTMSTDGPFAACAPAKGLCDT